MGVTVSTKPSPKALCVTLSPAFNDSVSAAVFPAVKLEALALLREAEPKLVDEDAARSAPVDRGTEEMPRWVDVSAPPRFSRGNSLPHPDSYSVHPSVRAPDNMAVSKAGSKQSDGISRMKSETGL